MARVRAHVRVLGPACVTIGDTLVLTAPRRLAVLAYLLLARPRGMHARESLIAMFWPESDSTGGRHALRNVLHAIRNALGDDVILTAGDTLVGIDEARVACDALCMESHLAAGRLAEAMAAYEGEFLQGFHVAGAPAFCDWLEQERRRMKGSAIDAARGFAAERRRDRDLAGAVEAARWACSVDADDEALFRTMLDLLGESGERAAAIRAYDAFATRLRAEYGAEPDAETQRVLASIRGSAPSPAQSNPQASMACVRGTYLFLRSAATGHRADLERARELFEAALEIDPGFASAYAGLSNYYAVAAVRDILKPFDECYGRMIEMSHRALALDSTLAIPHVHFGVKAMYIDGDWETAGVELARAVALDPAYAEAHRFLGVYLDAMGDRDGALRELREAVRCEPHIALFYNSLASALMARRDYAAAAAELGYALVLDPGYGAALDRLTRCHERLGDYGAAVATRLRDPGSATANQFAEAFARDGEAGYRRMRVAELRESIAAMAEAIERAPRERAADRLNPPQLRLALACAELGDVAGAREWEEHACRTRPDQRRWFTSHPDLHDVQVFGSTARSPRGSHSPLGQLR